MSALIICKNDCVVGPIIVELFYSNRLNSLKQRYGGHHWKINSLLCNCVSWGVNISSWSLKSNLTAISPTSNQIRLVAQSCPTLCDPMNHSTPGLPVHHQLPESTQTHVHRVSDAIQPSHPLSSPSPLAPNPSQH